MAERNIPAFPSLCNVWRFSGPTSPPGFDNLGAPALADEPCEVVLRQTLSGALNFNQTSDFEWQGLTVMIYFRKGVDVRGNADITSGPDTVEVPAGSGRIYILWDVQPVALGFPNEILCGMLALQQCKTPF